MCGQCDCVEIYFEQRPLHACTRVFQHTAAPLYHASRQSENCWYCKKHEICELRRNYRLFWFSFISPVSLSLSLSRSLLLSKRASLLRTMLRFASLSITGVPCRFFSSISFNGAFSQSIHFGRSQKFIPQTMAKCLAYQHILSLFPLSQRVRIVYSMHAWRRSQQYILHKCISFLIRVQMLCVHSTIESTWLPLYSVFGIVALNRLSCAQNTSRRTKEQVVADSRKIHKHAQNMRSTFFEHGKQWPERHWRKVGK